MKPQNILKVLGLVVLAFVGVAVATDGMHDAVAVAFVVGVLAIAAPDALERVLKWYRR